VFVNEAFVRLTGYSRQQVLGRPCNLLHGEKTDLNELDRLQQALASGEPVRSEQLNYAQGSRPFWTGIDMAPIRSVTDACTHWVFVQSDLSHRTRSSAEIEHLAYHDALTGLANRTLLLDRLHQTLAGCARNPVFCGLMFIDLDNFKEANDAGGHAQGDQLLLEVAVPVFCILFSFIFYLLPFFLFPPLHLCFIRAVGGRTPIPSQSATSTYSDAYHEKGQSPGLFSSVLPPKRDREEAVGLLDRYITRFFAADEA
jgi:PAS domain S-box-containing protein